MNEETMKEKKVKYRKYKNKQITLKTKNTNKK